MSPQILDRCVKHLKAQGMSEDSAYGVCVKSTGWKKAKGGGWTKKKKSSTFDDSLKRRKK